MTWHQARVLLRVLLLSCLCLAGLAILFTVALVVVTSIGGATGLCRVSVGIDNGRSQFVDCGGLFQAVYKADTFAVSEPIPEFVGPPEPGHLTNTCIAYNMAPTFKRPDGTTMPVSEAMPHIREAWFHYAGVSIDGHDPCMRRVPLRVQMNRHRQLDSRLRRNGVTYVKCDGVHVICRNIGPRLHRRWVVKP